MHYGAVTRVFESFVKPNDSREAQLAGAHRFAEQFRAELGLSVSEFGGRPTIDKERKGRFNPGEWSIRGLAESLCGHQWAESLNQQQANGYRVAEAGTAAAAIHPGNLPNVSAFLGSVTGLLDASILETYEAPEFIIDTLVDVVQSKTRQHSMIGVGIIGDVRMRRNPGDPYNFAQFQERYIRTPETQQDALGCQVTFEAVYFDQTSQVLDRARSVGTVLGRQKEFDGFSVIAGVTNPYNYNGTGYNTYLTSGNWINKVTGNTLTDWTQINVVNAMFSRMTDQETGNRIAVTPDTLICSPTKKLTARYIQAATDVEARTPTTQAVVTRAPNLGEVYRIVSSPYLDQILTAAATANIPGLALAQSVADAYWWLLKTGKGGAFYRVENWPLQTATASPDSYSMLNQKLLLAVFADQMHVFGVKEPRYVIESTN